MTRLEILGNIKRLADANGGIPPGEDRLRQLGITPAMWGKYWARLTQAQREAGLTPNVPQPAYSDDVALQQVIDLARELGAIPTSRDRIVKHGQDSTFPSERVFKRLGPKSDLVARLIEYIGRHPGNDDVLSLLQRESAAYPPPTNKKSNPRFGSVYLLKGPGRRYKVGRASVFGRRARQLSIQLPFETKKVHVIETDDPEGVEKYWHNRFEAKRINSEWFELASEDVAAFKRWKRLR
jgi:hypothetical protein